MTHSRSLGKEEPRYKRALRIVGRYLNQRKARMATIAEIEGGFVIHFAAENRPNRLEGLALQADDLYDLERIFLKHRPDEGRGRVFGGMQSFLGFRRDEGLAFQRSHPVCPQGYEEVLRTLGSRLDARHAQDVLITEMANQIVMDYTLPVYGAAARAYAGMTGATRHETYTRAEVESLVSAERARAQQAIEGTAERLRFEPGDHRLYLEAGRMFHDEGDFSEAAEIYRIVISLVPNDVEAYRRLGELSLERGQYREAATWLTRALQVDPHNARCHDLLGLAYRNAGDMTRARAAFEQAMTLDPTNRAHRLHLAQVLPAPSRTPEAPRAEAPATPAPVQPAPGQARDQIEADEDRGAEPAAPPMAADPGEEPAPTAPPVVEPAPGLLVDPLGWDLTGQVDAAGWYPEPLAVVTESGPHRGEDPPAEADAGVAPEGDDPFERRYPEGAEAGDHPTVPDGPGEPEDQRPVEVAPEAVRPADLPHDPWSSLPPAPPDSISAPPVVSVSAVPEDQVEVAIATLREAIIAHPEQRDLHRKLGFLLARQGRTAEAAQEFGLARGDQEI